MKIKKLLDLFQNSFFYFAEFICSLKFAAIFPTSGLTALACSSRANV